MFSVRYGGKKGKTHKLLESKDLVAVRTHSCNPLITERAQATALLSPKARDVLDDFTLEARFPLAGVEVLRTQKKRGALEVRDTARKVLKQEQDVRFAGRVLQDEKSKKPVLYTENLFVKFEDDRKAAACKKLLKKYKLTVKRELAYARNAYFVEAKEGTGTAVFDLAASLLDEDGVEFCHPELIREIRRLGAFPPQWHLKRTTVNGNNVNAHASVEAAWAMTEGTGAIIAVIDDGVDLDHDEFRSSGKIVAPLNASVPSTHPNRTNPRPGGGDNHGTACAGVACADGRHGASGVAPRARLMPIRLISGLGSQDEADAFIHAAQNGADVISCSWGPPDGSWLNPSDPLHNQVTPLPDSTRLAIDWAIRNGRNGKGCVIVWAAGNGNESVDNDGYASYDKVIAVAACNDTGTKSAYSDFGDAIWCAFPSNHGRPSLTPGIWTTDRSGASGYNPGQTSRGDAAGNYTNSFGGTSSAAPGVAGVAALLLAHNPELRWDEVKDLLKRSADKIDAAGGAYDANGHSRLYGFGRVNARKAVALAQPAQPKYTATHTARQDVPIKDLQTSTLAIKVAETKAVKAIAVSVDIEHTFIGDLFVRVKGPAGTAALHSGTGGGADNLKQRYDPVNAPDLAAFVGQKPQGEWSLEVEDRANRDVGVIRSFSVELIY